MEEEKVNPVPPKAVIQVNETGMRAIRYLCEAARRAVPLEELSNIPGILQHVTIIPEEAK